MPEIFIQEMNRVLQLAQILKQNAKDLIDQIQGRGHDTNPKQG